MSNCRPGNHRAPTSAARHAAIEPASCEKASAQMPKPAQSRPRHTRAVTTDATVVRSASILKDMVRTISALGTAAAISKMTRAATSGMSSASCGCPNAWARSGPEPHSAA
jgi:hypothetical protein